LKNTSAPGHRKTLRPKLSKPKATNIISNSSIPTIPSILSKICGELGDSKMAAPSRITREAGSLFEGDRSAGELAHIVH
jgi:hypothetical protein